MTDLKKEIAEKITANRPKLSASSLKTYVSILTNIYKGMKGEGDKIEFFSDNVEDTLKYLDSKNIHTKKTSLSALYVLTGKPEYRRSTTHTSSKKNHQSKKKIG